MNNKKNQATLERKSKTKILEQNNILEINNSIVQMSEASNTMFLILNFL